MNIIQNNYYKSEWHGMDINDVFNLSNNKEKELMEFLKEKCGFEDFMQTAKLIRTEELKKAIPDIVGVRNGIRYLIDLKRKNRLLLRPQTGFDEEHCNDYLDVAKMFNMECLIVFLDNIDELNKEAKERNIDCYSKFINPDGTAAYYGGFLDRLYKKINPNNTYFYVMCPRKKKKILLFNLDMLQKLDSLFEERQTMLNFEV